MILNDKICHKVSRNESFSSRSQAIKRAPITGIDAPSSKLEVRNASLITQNGSVISADNFVQTADPRLSDTRDPNPGSASYIQNGTTQQGLANFNVDGSGSVGGTLSGNAVNSATQYNIGGVHVLSVPGDDNTFTGVSTGTANTSGGMNSFFGSSAGVRNTTGSRNSFFGNSAGERNTTGEDNSFFGFSAGISNITGSSNVSVGRFAGSSNTSGDNNTLLGAHADVFGNSLTYATAIGSRARVFTSNTIVLGRLDGEDTVKIPGDLNVGGNITGSFAVPAANITGTLPMAAGGTGLDSSGAGGNILRSDGTNWTSSPLQAADIPTGSANYIQNSNTPQDTANFNITGLGTANTFNAAAQYNIGGNRVLGISTGDNTFAGRDAGELTTPSGLFGIRNSFFGRFAGFSNISGPNNSFFGRGAGYDNSTGGGNTFIGNESGFNNTTGSGNTFMGGTSGFTNTTGSKNTIIGLVAGTRNKTGSNNTIIGSEANIAIDADPLNFASAIGAGAIVGASDTIVLGKAAGSYEGGLRSADAVQIPGTLNVAGDINTTTHVNIGGDRILSVDGGNLFTGFEAGKANTTGNDNAFFGRFAGADNETGTLNTYVGTLANGGRFANNNTLIGSGTASGNKSFATAIGSGALAGGEYSTAVGAGAVASADNTVVLGRDIDTVEVPGIKFKLSSVALSHPAANPVCYGSGYLISACSSSLRFKTDIKPFNSGLNLVNRLKPITFNWKDGGLPDVGLGAEDVEAIEPLLVTYNASGQIQGVKYDRIGVVLLNAVKEQQAQIERQEKRLTEQQALIDELRRLVCKTENKSSVCK